MWSAFKALDLYDSCYIKDDFMIKYMIIWNDKVEYKWNMAKVSRTLKVNERSVELFDTAVLRPYNHRNICVCKESS